MLCVLVGAVAGRALVGYRGASEKPSDPPSPRTPAVLWLLLLGAAVLSNLHTLGVGFLADDFGLLRAARLAAAPLDAMRLVPLQLLYRPVSELVWWFGVRLWGGSALGYHLLSVLLHAGNTAMLFLLARRYLGSTYGGATAALFFAVHPVHVEATTWAAAQPDLLCTAFSLSSMWCLEQHLSARGYLSKLALAVALAAFLLALGSKETAVALLPIVVVRLAVLPRDQRTARAGAAYAMALGVYLAARLFVLGEHWLGGGEFRPSFWQAVLSPMPLLLANQLFFPVHPGLFDSLLPSYLRLAAIAVMALGLLWWIRGLESVPWQRLALGGAYLVAPMIPVATAGLTIGADMASSRYGYLPSVGLALLFGALCAGRQAGRRQSRLVAVAILCAAAALSVWYVTPWRQAARLRDSVLSAGVRLVEALPKSPPPSAIYVRGLPSSHLGAQVFYSCFSLALPPLLSRQIAVVEIPPTTAAWDMVSFSDLRPGEYLVSWDEKTRTMLVERAGGDPAGKSQSGSPP